MPSVWVGAVSGKWPTASSDFDPNNLLLTRAVWQGATLNSVSWDSLDWQVEELGVNQREGRGIYSWLEGVRGFDYSSGLGRRIARLRP